MEENRAGLMMCEIDIGKEVSEVEGRLYQVPHIIGIFGWALVVHDIDGLGHSEIHLPT